MAAVATAPKADAPADQGVIRTRIPARLDRLPWSRFHWRILIGLGTVWILDGLEVTNVGNVASRLTQSGSGITITVAQIGFAGGAYVAGACLGALFFGHLTDRFGRKRLFMITLGVYIASTALTAISVDAWMFILFRFLTGTGIGGEYAAINSAIDELIPARARGRIDLAINGSYWFGAILAAGLALIFLDESIFAANVGWRLAFAIGVGLALLILLVRRNVPESPRWLFIHGREDEAERIVDGIEHEVTADTRQPLAPARRTITVRPRQSTSFREIARTAFRTYPTRSILCLTLFIGQAFLYNGITFNLGTLLTTFFGVASGVVPVFIVVYAASNLSGPLVLGRLFDTVGRKPMISATYIGSAVLGAVLIPLFLDQGLLGPWTFMIIIMATFFLASAGASSAYLTASEIFPMETRALAIAFFYAVGTAVGGISGSFLFGGLIGSGHRSEVVIAFAIGAAVMLLGGLAELLWGVRAEGASLEDIAAPLSSVEQGSGGPGQSTHQMGALQARERANVERARAAELRAAGHEHLAAGTAGDRAAVERAEVEFQLADVADQVALAHDELATMCEERARAEEAEDDVGLAAAGQRARAAEERAWSHHQEAQSLVTEDDQEAERHRQLAAAALERAREQEQRALADEARGRAESAEGADGAVDQNRARMHGLWARMHAERAQAHQQQAEGDVAGATQRFHAAEALEERARAAGFMVEAEERRHDVERQRDEEESVGRSLAAAHEELEESERRARSEARIERRLDRRRRQEVGLRRFRPGPGRTASFFGTGVPSPVPEEALDNEIEAIERALSENGPMDREELARLVGARYWGPGVFAEALRQAVIDDGARRVSRTMYGPPDRRERQATGR